jgi:hypothetical protein
MLGSVQVAVSLPNGLRCGYSGDFSWPLDDVIQVDELVIDTTYGSPASVRTFTQEQADHRLTELVLERVKFGPVLIRAHRGTLQRAISCLDESSKWPIVASVRLSKELDVYSKYGYSLNKVVSIDSEMARTVRKEGRYIRVFGGGDPIPADPGKATTIVLSAYMSRTDDPVTQTSQNSFVVAMTGHADYAGTIEYVRATGAKKVVTDNTRGGHAVELALALRRELHIDANPSLIHHTHEWGR